MSESLHDGWTRRQFAHLTGLSLLGLTVGRSAPVWAAEGSPEAKGLAIARETERRTDGFVDDRGDLTMILRDAHGREAVRKLSGAALERPEDADRALIVFSEPAEVRGAVLLTHNHVDRESEQWMYLPALSRVRRISTASRSGPFMGSEFSFEDMTLPTVEKFTYRWLRDEPLDGGWFCHVVERYPKDKNSGYSKAVVWVDTEHYRVVQATYYDRKGMHQKTLLNHDFKQFSGRFWRPMQSEMTNHQTLKSTRLVWQNVAYGVDLDTNDFLPSQLEHVSRRARHS